MNPKPQGEDYVGIFCFTAGSLQKLANDTNLFQFSEIYQGQFKAGSYQHARFGTHTAVKL